MRIHWRADWPAGSNARLLAAQLRCSTGASAIGGQPSGPTLARAVADKALAARGGKAPDAAARLALDDAAIMAAFGQVLEFGGVLPPDAGLARMSGLSLERVRQALERLRQSEVIAIEMRGTRRAIRLVAEGVVLRTGAAPIVAEAE